MVAQPKSVLSNQNTDKNDTGNGLFIAKLLDPDEMLNLPATKLQPATYWSWDSPSDYLIAAVLKPKVSAR